MKILSVKNYEKEELEFKVLATSQYLKSIITREQAKKEKIDVYVNEHGHYVIGKEETNFVFLDLKSYPLYGRGERIVNFFYELDVLINRRLYKIQLMQNEIYEEKWIKGIKAEQLVIISKSKYEKIIKKIEPRIDKKICFENIGVHKVDGKFFYVASNCAITAQGINKEIRALQEGFELEFDEKVQEREYAEKFLRYNLMNLKIFYPIHCMQILAILQYFLRKKDISAGLVLWIDGEVASGKTELAVTAGDIFNRCGDNSSIKKNLYSTKIKPKDLEKKLLEYQNAVFVLDDVKKEESVRNKENVKNVTDLVVRSVYMGKLGQAQFEDDTVSATAIITGEFFKEQMSTVSRILYLNVGNFLQERDNSENFKKLQKDKTYFAGFMVGFLTWLFKNLEKETQGLDLGGIIKDVSEELDRESMDGILSTRMKETHNSMLICTRVVSEYFREILGNSNKVNEFFHGSKRIIDELIRDTWYKSLGYRPIYERAFDDIISGLRIKDCRYGGNYLSARKGQISVLNAEIRKSERGNSYNSSTSLFEKGWLLRYDRSYAGILLNFGQEDILLLNKTVLCKRIRDYVKENEKEWHIRVYMSDYTDKRIIDELADSRRIYVQKRSDNAFNRVFDYPVTLYDTDSNILEDIGEDSMVKVYITQEKSNLIERIIDKPMDGVFDWIEIRDELRGNRYYKELAMKIDMALEKMNKFLDLK